MSIELDQADREGAIQSIVRFFEANMDEPVGNLQAGALLEFFLREIAPCVYNRAVRDVQARLQQRVMDLDAEVYEEEFAYWKTARRR
ncbi:DUF2164 domain-containing protein [Paludibacterium paludis]|uniref:DUF2164 domain-containing protein n=1 Tax=Paludibacterium paludis TaxID=1225769 RepID=A0A918NX02_9NEIS|nr:DUF2164 domain-containing protein [Paludibacterium paludis]GGY03041.1 hypothetical protein GCM10011289_01550 [Paludibacterium paludis]